MADEDFMAVAELIVHLAREVRIRAHVAGRGVPLNQTDTHVMRYIHLHPGCAPSEIAAATGLHRANVSASLGVLRDLGFAVTRRNELDGRSIRVHPTAHAEETVARLRTAWGDLLQSAWGEDEHDADLELMRRRLGEVLARLAARPA